MIIEQKLVELKEGDKIYIRFRSQLNGNTYQHEAALFRHQGGELRFWMYQHGGVYLHDWKDHENINITPFDGIEMQGV